MGLETLALAATVAGTTQSVASTLKQGKIAEQIGEQRAAIDEQNAEAVREASVEKAKIQGERGRRIRAEQKGKAAASGIRINVGSPLVIEAETKANIAKDIGFGLERGRTEADAFRSSAALERFAGKKARRQSKFSALAQGIQGAGSIAFLGSQLPGSTDSPIETTPLRNELFNVKPSTATSRIPLRDTLTKRKNAFDVNASFIPFGDVRA